VALYKTVFFDFCIRPPSSQNLLPNICTKSPISRLVWQIDRRWCLRLLGCFWGWPIQWNHAKCCGANPCCHDNEIWARRGDLVAYRLVDVCVCCVWMVIVEHWWRGGRSEWETHGSVGRGMPTWWYTHHSSHAVHWKSKHHYIVLCNRNITAGVICCLFAVAERYIHYCDVPYFLHR